MGSYLASLERLLPVAIFSAAALCRLLPVAIFEPHKMNSPCEPQIAPNDRTKLRQLRDHADLAEGARREAKWREAGYHIISMKNDFKTIYGYGVEKTDFVFE